MFPYRVGHRFKKFVAWSASLLTGLTVLAWIASGFLGLFLGAAMHNPQWGVGISEGTITFTSAGSKSGFNPAWMVMWYTHPFALNCGLPHWEQARRCIEIGLPLWCVVLLIAVPAILLRKHFRSMTLGHCHVCDYDLRTNTTGVCPECGTRIPKRIRKDLLQDHDEPRPFGFAAFDPPGPETPPKRRLATLNRFLLFLTVVSAGAWVFSIYVDATTNFLIWPNTPAQRGASFYRITIPSGILTATQRDRFDEGAVGFSARWTPFSPRSVLPGYIRPPQDSESSAVVGSLVLPMWVPVAILAAVWLAIMGLSPRTRGMVQNVEAAQKPIF